MNNLVDVFSLVDERSWASSYKAGNSLEHSVYRLSLAASFYWDWREQNFIRDLISQIEGVVRACMASRWGIKKSGSKRLLALRWRV